jgi:hypothetical protein
MVAAAPPTSDTWRAAVRIGGLCGRKAEEFLDPLQHALHLRFGGRHITST